MDGQDTRKFQIEATIESHFHLFQERSMQNCTFQQ